MGTASQCAKDPVDKKAVDDMLLEAKKSDQRRAGLYQAIGEVIRSVIFDDPALGDIRDRISTAVQRKVKADVVKKFQDWKRDPDPNKAWPFIDKT
jgi:hypothetical protein